jgi:hypothetical protein
VISFIYSRLHDNKKALSFIDDIDSPNAENIKGNIRLRNKEYELAFGHFKLALNKKEDVKLHELEGLEKIKYMSESDREKEIKNR